MVFYSIVISFRQQLVASSTTTPSLVQTGAIGRPVDAGGTRLIAGLSQAKPIHISQPITQQSLPNQQQPLNMSLYQHSIYPSTTITAPPIAHTKVTSSPMPTIGHPLHSQFMVTPSFSTQKSTLVRGHTPPPRAHALQQMQMPVMPPQRPRSPPPHQPRTASVQAVPPQHASTRSHSPNAAKPHTHMHPIALQKSAKPQPPSQQRSGTIQAKSPTSSTQIHMGPPKAQTPPPKQAILMQTQPALRLASPHHGMPAHGIPHLLSTHAGHPVHAMPVAHAHPLAWEIREQQHKVNVSSTQQVTSKPGT